MTEMTEYVQVPGGKAVLQYGKRTQILIPSSALKGGGSSAIPAALILMMLEWIWKFLTSTVDLKQDRILEGIDILKTYMEKAPGFVKKENINKEWNTEVNSRIKDAALLSLDTYMHTLDMEYQRQGLRTPEDPPLTIYKDNTKPEEESKAGPSDFTRYYSDEKLFSFAIPSDESAMRSDIRDIKDMLTTIEQFVDQQKLKEEESKTPADTSKIEGDVQPVSLPAEQVNIMDEIRNAFNNIVSSFGLHAGEGSVENEGKILTISLTDENANNISTMIVNKMNEEKTVETEQEAGQTVSHEDIGIEVRDTKRAVQGDIAEVKSLLTKLIDVIEKRAMTFDDIYKKFGYRLARDHRTKTGRIVG